MIDTAKLLPKAGNYKLAPSGAVTDRTLLEIATQFENQVSRKMTALTPDQLAKRYTGAEPILQTTKYDGEGVFVSYDKGSGAFAFNAPSGRVRVGFPALEALAAQLASKGVQKALLRCELYLPHTNREQKRPTISDVLRVSFNGTAEEVAALKLCVLDIIMLDGRDLRPNQEKFQETWELIGKLCGTDETKAYHRAAGEIVPEKNLAQIFEERVAAGSEGLVIRRLQRLDIAKTKPHLSIDAVVIGFVEGEFEGKYGVTSLLTALAYPEKRDGKLVLQTFARVGSGFTDQQREELLGTFKQIEVAAPIAMTDSDGRTVHFVKPTHIVELHGEDLVLSSGRDRENRTQVFAVDDRGFEFLGLGSFPRLTFATFAQFRADKSLNAGGARIEQVTPNPLLPEFRAESLAAPKVLRREVYVKGDAVRKLVVLQTAGENRMPFVVYWTDYSAKRKEPLKVSTECAYTEARAQALAERLIAENVTKGFVKAGAEAPAATAASDAPAEAEAPAPKKKRASTKKQPAE